MNTSLLRPKQIRQTAPDALLVTWSDDHQSPFSTEYLRRKCPCATCLPSYEESGTNRMFPLMLADQARIAGLELSGHNAMVITWGDGHKEGIFTWDYLRSICSCAECAGGR